MDIFQLLEITGIIKIILFGISAGIGMASFRYIKPFFLWIKGGVENGDGVLENKDLQIAVFTIFCAFILLTFAFMGIVWPIYIVTAVFTVTAALFGVKSIGQSYVESRKNKNIKDSSDDELG